MTGQHEQLTRLQTALAQLSAPPATAAVLYPGTERYSLITFLLQKLLTPELVNTLQQRAADIDLPPGISAEEIQAHRLACILQTVDFHATVDQVRGCTSPEESLHVLASLAILAAAHQQYSAEAANAATAGPGLSSSGRASSPAPFGASSSASGAHGPSATPRQRTPNRTGGHSSGSLLDGGGGGGRPLLGLHSLDAEMRTLECLVDRLPQYLEQGGGTNWFPGDIMVALQPYLQSQSQSIPELAATLEQQAQKLREGTPALRAEVAKLAAEVTVATEAEWLQQAEATRLELADLLQTSAAFYQTFQTGLGVWCQASKAAETCGLGPMAAEFVQRYEAVRSLGSDLARVRQAYNSIVSCAPPLTLLEQHTLSQLVRAGQAAVEQAHARIAVIQRLLGEGEAEATRAAAVLRAANAVQVAGA